MGPEPERDVTIGAAADVKVVGSVEDVLVAIGLDGYDRRTMVSPAAIGMPRSATRSPRRPCA